ncbi:MAG: hypothetical protein V1929_03820 [bacterium]
MNRRNLFNFLFAVTTALFVVSPALSGRLDPNDYAGGRSRNVLERALRNSSAVATMLGEFRTTMSDIMYIKTERYLDNGIAYMPHLKKQLLSVSSATKAIDEHQAEVHEAEAGGEHGHAHHDHEADDDGAGTKTMIPTEAEDFRGIIGRLQREVKPWRDPSQPHQHTDGTELLPWFRLMTLSDPHYVLGYTVGGWWLKSRNLEAAIRFAKEGIENNSESFQVHFTLGQIYLDKGRRIAGNENMLAPPPDALKYLLMARDCYLTAAELAIAQRPANASQNPDNPSWGHYLEDDARATCHMAALFEWHYGDKARAKELARHYLQALGKDTVLERISQRDG